MIEWRKSSRSDQGEAGSCVELAKLSETVGVRDSKNATKPHLAVDRAALGVLFNRIKLGELDHQ